MIGILEARKLMAESLVDMAGDIAVICEEDASRVSSFVNEFAEIACEMMPQDVDHVIYFKHFADGLTDGFSLEYVVEEEVDRDQAGALVESGMVDKISQEHRFKAACYILDMEDLGEFPDNYGQEDKIAAATAYTDGYSIGRDRYSYLETHFGEPAMYVDSRAVKSALMKITQE